MVIAARIYLLRCYAKNVKTDLTADEKKALKQVAAHLKGRSSMTKKTATKKKTFGADLIEGMKLVLAHQRGKIELEQVWPTPIDVKAIRKRVKMSQAEFSRAYGISKRALQEWEQGGRQPDSAARAYLTVIAKEPAVVRRALAGE
ncbi:MAG TPA: helix-turn-helix domain-containing protein [Bryobacteraceae bacterium]|nr:helix-turn-helix domain-containing protein [Bryobacteraceae bacterium]